MYYNKLGEKVSKTRFKQMYNAMRERQGLIREDLMKRRDLAKMGLLAGAGYLLSRTGLSARGSGRWEAASQTTQTCESISACKQCASPPTRPWAVDLPIMPIKQQADQLDGPPPQIQPNRNINPQTGLPYEGRTRAHQAPALGFPFPPQVLYQVRQEQFMGSMHPDLPLQCLWGFDGMSPGPTYKAFYDTPILVRNYNNLPLGAPCDGFGKNSVSTHLHNGHTPSESDGFPCDYFEVGQYYDQYYPNVLAGFNSNFRPDGDINESLSTLWYHDHRVSFTAQNVYKGLAGFYLLFNRFDTGDETSGFHLPTHPDFDIPMIFADRCFDATSGAAQLFFDLMCLDGILGDKFLVNGKIQPVLHVHPRRYRFRWLNTGPSRFYQIYLTDPGNLSANNMFWQIANDGNLLPQPVHVPAVALGVAERADVIIDFSQFANQTLYLENRLQQTSGRGPDICTDSNGHQFVGPIKAPGTGDLLLKICVDLPHVDDDSVDPATEPHFYDLPDTTATPRVTRNFVLHSTAGGQWKINGSFFDCDTPCFAVQQNSVEHWTLSNGQQWSHPIHIHLEEHQILQCAPGLYPMRLDSICNSDRVVTSRKDVVRVSPGVGATPIKLFFRFRDWLGRYPLHCHNVIHEDHAMMMRWDVVPAPGGDCCENPCPDQGLSCNSACPP